MDTASTKKMVLFISILSSFLTPFMGSAVNITLPSLGKELSASVVMLNWVTTSYILTSAICLVPFGVIADLYGRKKVFLYGIILFTFSSFLCSISVSIFTLLLFRVLQGIGGAMIMATGMAILTSVFPSGERGKAIGISTSAVYLGLSLGPFLGGILTQYAGWRSVFLTILPIGLATIILIIWKLKGEWKESKDGKIDWLGFFLYPLSIISLMYGISILPRSLSWWLIIVGFLCLCLFVFWEKHQENPLINTTIFRDNTIFTFSNISALINYSATFGVTFLLALYLQYIKGINPQRSGMILLAQPLMMTIFSPFAGRASDKIEPQLVASSGMFLNAVALFMLIFLGKNTSLSLVIANLALLGIGFALFSSPNTNAVMSSIPKSLYGVASGILGTMRLTGQMTSMGIIMLISTLYIGNVQITPEYYPTFLISMKISFAVFAFLCFIGIFTSIARGKLHKNKSNTDF
ncbi:MAG TPA: MFS transporter [Candidatus Hydrogenedens sp.]|nr:MFS transporter [Candidatus Hydrogenedens sp.]HPP59622.1 MFS transporter [Candidatus Hydrogenedens sp.]